VADAPAARLTLLMREDCPLCDHLHLALLAWLALHRPGTGVVLRDVDSDAGLARRYGLRIPVLLLDDVRVCEGSFDAAELARLLQAR
jgi:hypothetical protein